MLPGVCVHVPFVFSMGRRTAFPRPDVEEAAPAQAFFDALPIPYSFRIRSFGKCESGGGGVTV